MVSGTQTEVWCQTSWFVWCQTPVEQLWYGQRWRGDGREERGRERETSIVGMATLTLRRPFVQHTAHAAHTLCVALWSLWPKPPALPNSYLPEAEATLKAAECRMLVDDYHGNLHARNLRPLINSAISPSKLKYTFPFFLESTLRP